MIIKDIEIYKQKFQSLLLSSEGIVRLLSDEGFQPDTAEMRLLYRQIFPYLYSGPPAAPGKPYLCFEVDIPGVPTASYKEMKLMVRCCCKEPLSGSTAHSSAVTPADTLANLVDVMLCDRTESFGFGRLKLKSTHYLRPMEGYYGKQLVYTCFEFI